MWPEHNQRDFDKGHFLLSKQSKLLSASPYSHDCIPVTLLLYATVSEELPLTTEQDRIALLPLSIFISLLK